MTSLASTPVPRPFGRSLLASPATALFMSVFTSQAAVLVLSPILVDVARDFDVSTAVAGQLRIVAAPVAALVAIAVVRAGARLPYRLLLSGGAAFVGVGSLASAVAPSFVALAIAQVPLWIGVATLVAGGIGAAGAWSAPEERSRLVARSLAGAPAAWIVGMPTIGWVAETDWRLAFLAVPLPAAVVTVALLAAIPGGEPELRAAPSLLRLLRAPRAGWWAIGELLAMSAWAGTLVFSGALFIETYGASARLTGIVLATVAGAYLAGNLLGGRMRGACARRALAWGNVGAAVAVALTWIVTPHLLVTVALFGLAAAIVAARTVTGTTYGFVLAGERKLEVGGARAALTHVGYLAGSLLGGAALAIGGGAAVGIAFGSLFLAAAAPYLLTWSTRCELPAQVELAPA
ncbi:MAG TPA: MFS transporter [Gaiellaceae bacterium]|nr:MFS transporter [Gaiellaceae bacterium]